MDAISGVVESVVDVVVGKAVFQVSSTTVPANALLNDDGTPIINDDGEYILTGD